jgi:oxalate decarboxylase
MNDRNFDDNQNGLTRRQLLGLATLTGAGLATASMGVPKAKAAAEDNPEGAHTEQFTPLEDFTYDLEGSEGWVGQGGTAKEQTVKQLPVSKSIAGGFDALATRRSP